MIIILVESEASVEERLNRVKQQLQQSSYKLTHKERQLLEY